jgi:hypothetical protein
VTIVVVVVIIALVIFFMSRRPRRSTARTPQGEAELSNGDDRAELDGDVHESHEMDRVVNELASTPRQELPADAVVPELEPHSASWGIQQTR